MAVSGAWGPLTPPEQSTSYADLVLGNVFETLVDTDSRGNLIPGLAKSWKISPDMRSFEFKIDITRRFSNGKFLSAKIYKDSFKHSLKVKPASANSSSLDLMYQIEGFEDFERTGELNGIVAEDDDVLILKFKKPFRQALFQLTGIRFAAYVYDENGKYHGTGPYQIEYYDQKKLKMAHNPFAGKKAPFPKAEISVVEENWRQAYCDGLYDIYSVSSGVPLDCDLPDNRSFVLGTGAIMKHSIVDVNGIGTRIFSDPKLRRALLYIFWEYVLHPIAAMKDGGIYQSDIQFFQPLQPGRLELDEVEHLIQEGKIWMEILKRESQKNPIHICSSDKDLLNIIVKALTDIGIGTRPELMTFSELMKRAYKTVEYDLLLSGAGTGGLDPDDLYHYLGQHGAITSPGIGRAKVWDAFETGRGLMDPVEINHSYQEANRAILTEVPSIHMGFQRSGVVYSQDSLVFDSVSLNKERFNLSQFSPRQ